MSLGFHISPEESQKIQALRAAGCSLSDIALELNRSGSGIWGHLKRLAKRHAGEVKCLGGCGKTFASPDRLRIRICPVCKKRHQNDALPSTYALHL